MKPATTSDHRTFCEVDGWERKGDKPGRHVSKHEIWTKRLADGTLLRTSVSKGDRQYGQQLYSRILTHQLQVTSKQFWDAVDRDIKPKRPGEVAMPAAERRIPLWMFVRLKRELGYTEDEIRTMGPREAEKRFRSWEKREFRR
jgi:hypothetical protein